jgi:hypothetical protein
MTSLSISICFLQYRGTDAYTEIKTPSPIALLYAVQGYGINVEIVDGASPSTHVAAEALAKALRNASLAVYGPQTVSPQRAARVGTEARAMSPLLDANTIVLGVLTHPN